MSKVRGDDQVVISEVAPTPPDEGGSRSPWAPEQRPQSAVEMLWPSAYLNRTELSCIYHQGSFQFIFSQKFCCTSPRRTTRNFPQSQLIILSTYHLAGNLWQKSTARISSFLNDLRGCCLHLEILQWKSTAIIFLVSTYHLFNLHILEQLCYKVNEEKIIGFANLNRSFATSSAHNCIVSGKLSLVLLIIRRFEKAHQAGRIKEPTERYLLSLQGLEHLKQPRILVVISPRKTGCNIHQLYYLICFLKT